MGTKYINLNLKNFLIEADMTRASDDDMDIILNIINKYFFISNWKIIDKASWEVIAEPSMIELVNAKEIFEYMKVLARNHVYA